MARPLIHRFEREGRRFALDPETCFCFECDAISWDVLEHYPHEPISRIVHLLKDRHDPRELHEVVGELEWLRATNSILRRPKPQDVEAQLRPERGLKHLALQLPIGAETVMRRRWFGSAKRDTDLADIDADVYELARNAVMLLLNRSGQQRELRLSLLQGGRLGHVSLLVDVVRDALRAAVLAEKKLHVELVITGLSPQRLPEAVQGHPLSLALELGGVSRDEVEAVLTECARMNLTNLTRIAKSIKDAAADGRVVLRPSRPDFAAAVEELQKAGFEHIEIDLDGALATNPGLNPSEMMASFHQAAVLYANHLLKGRYYRLDPVAGLFWRIYDGQPLHRADGAGVTELAVNADGDVYPASEFFGHDEFCIGVLQEGRIDGDMLAQFDSVGAATTGACRRCWARNLCGGGHAAVHHALSGSIRTPHEPWCNAQREWMTAAVSAFNVLSSAGVNFARMYQSLQRGPKPSMLSMVRTALKMTLAMRPIEESDAAMLVRWENWTEAAYFLYNETGLLMATQYDREMDSLHPQGIDMEMMLIRKDGTPLGLLKVRPGQVPGTASAWVYLRHPGDYEAADLRRGLRTLLGEAAKQQRLRRLTVFALGSETGLHGFLEGAGFTREGIQREGVYLHGGYRDVHYYGLVFEPS